MQLDKNICTASHVDSWLFCYLLCVHACVRAAYVHVTLILPPPFLTSFHNAHFSITTLHPPLTSAPPPSHPSQFSHLRLPSLHGDWLTVPNLSMVAPDSCCIFFSEGCGESGPQSKFYQEVSPTLSTPLHMQGQQGMLDSVATTTSAGGWPILKPCLCLTLFTSCSQWTGRSASRSD